MSVEYLRECFEYDATSGELYWKARPREHFKTLRGYNTFISQRFDKKVSNDTGKSLYKTVGINKKIYYVHDIVWRLHFDRQVGMSLDHINGDKKDNRIDNLREVTHHQNLMNQKANSKGKTSKYKGVSLQSGRWTALVHLKGKSFYLGWFLDEEDAARAYDAKAKELFGKYALLNFKED